MNGYELSRTFWDFAFENPEKIKPNHVALFFFSVEHCNRLGWKHKFGLPTTMAKDAIGVRSYNTYKKTLVELVDFGFIEMIEVSKNQYSSNIIALSNFNKAHAKAQYKALDKALMKHGTKHMSKQGESTVQSICSIDKQYNHLTIEQLNNITIKQINQIVKGSAFKKYLNEKQLKLVRDEKQKIEFQKIIDIFNSVCKDSPHVQKITTARKNSINARVKEYGLNKIGDVFQKVSQSKFLCGDNDRGWVADFDWIMSPNKFIKILEGKYQNNEKPKKEIKIGRQTLSTIQQNAEGWN